MDTTRNVEPVPDDIAAQMLRAQLDPRNCCRLCGGPDGYIGGYCRACFNEIEPLD